MRSFRDKLVTLIEKHKVPLIVRLAPRLERLPLTIQRFDEPLLPFGKAVINATRGLVMGYSFDLAVYLQTGAAGAIALERTIDYAGADGESITILNGGFAMSDYVMLSDETSFGVDAVTITRQDLIETFTARPDRGVLVLTDRVVANEPKNILPSELAGLYHSDHQGIEIMVKGQQYWIPILDNMIYENRDDDFQKTIHTQVEQIIHVR